MVLESQDAAEKTAWLTLLTAITRTLGVRWLTPLEPLVAGENKVSQYAGAAEVGVRVPKTIVASDAETVLRHLHDEIVVKPLGPGHYYQSDGTPMVVFATPIPREAVASLPWSSAPFLVQERVRALRHYRCVTVGQRVWGAVLDAEGTEVDWRATEEAHSSFRSAPVPPALAEQALRLATKFGVAYSSQDWIEDRDGYVFLDLNPSGQWLFLPKAEGDAVADRIAAWLQGSP